MRGVSMCSLVWMLPAIVSVAVAQLLAFCLRFRWEAQVASLFACTMSHNSISSTGTNLVVE